MKTNLNLHSAYIAQIGALVASRGSLKVITQAMWHMPKQASKQTCMRFIRQTRDGLENRLQLMN